MTRYLYRTVVVLAVAILAAGCGTQSSSRSPGSPTPGGADIPPSAGVAGNPPPLTAGSPPATPALVPITPAPGRHERIAQWRLAGQADGGRRLLVDVSLGGPPCDTVTGLDVAETTTSVTLTVHAGRLTSAVCPPGVAGALATARLEAHLARPLGDRKLLGGL